MKISIVCPTRKRIKDVKRLLFSIHNTVKVPEQVEILFVIDDDDDETIQFVDKFKDSFDFGVKKVIIERNKYIFSDFANKALPYCDGEIFLAIGDDGTFNSNEWDEEIRKEFEQIDHKILLLHFNDLSDHCVDRAGHLAVHKNWIDVVGYFSPPWFDGDWGDWWMTFLADGASAKKYRFDIIIEHLNVWHGKAEPDETYHQHKIRREKLQSPDKNPDHPMNTKQDILRKNIEDLKQFKANFKRD